MSAVLDPQQHDPLAQVLADALEEGHGFSYAGGVTPEAAWALAQAGRAVLVDVRSAEERQFVGRVPGSVHVPWAIGTELAPDPGFVDALAARFDKDAVLLLLCRSGRRSALAAHAATAAGFSRAFIVLEGFEGELDGRQRRGTADGWRFHRLPWIQD